MSIYIPGMEMPTSDNHITLFLYPDRKVVVCGMLGPLGHYEAVPVPEHGRLIDAGALKPQTNGGRIRQMSDEELARFIAGQRGWYCDFKDPSEEEYPKVLGWLKQEAET